MADKVMARTTMRPDVEVELKGGERERKVLSKLGYLYEGSATTDAGARAAVEREQAEESGQPAG